MASRATAGFIVVAGTAAFACTVAAADDMAVSPAGYRASEAQANIFTYSSQETPAVAVAADGTALAVWGSRRQEEGSYGIYGRLFTADGGPIGGELHLNRYSDNNQERPAAAFDRLGNAWVVWQSFGQDGDQGAIVLRRLGEVDDKFTAIGDDLIVNTITEGDQTFASIATSGDRAIVTWTTLDGERQVVAARVFDLDGNALSDEFRLSDQQSIHEWLPAAAPLPDGQFVVTWATRKIEGRPAGLFAQRVNSSGELLGERIVVAPKGERIDVEPAIASDAQGRFVVAWMGASDFGGYDVYARRFGSDGVALGEEMLIMTAEEGWRSGAAVACAADGRFIVAANLEREIPADAQPHEPETPSDIIAQLYDASGEPSGEPFRMNQYRDGRQTLTIASNAARIAWHDDDRIVAAWHGRMEEDGSAVAVTTFSPRGLAASNHDLTVDDALLSRGIDPRDSAGAPPEFDPFHVPDPPDFPLNPGGDFGFIGFQSTGWTPPDPDIAAGPQHVVIAVNGGIRAYLKDGTLVFEDDISGSDGFWGEVGATHFVFDPVTVYDQLSDRFIVVTTEHGDPNRSIEIINLAVSQTSDPLDGWHKYRFNMESVGNFIDFPNLGVGPDAIYVTTDFFSSPRGNWITIINKDDVLNGRATTPRSIRTSTNIRSLGAITSLDANQPAQYFATSFTGFSTTIEIDAVRDPLGSPTRQTFSLTVPAYSNPPRAEQQGSSNRVATVDRRIKHGVLRNGRLWLAHTIGEANTARVRWYEVNMRGWPTSGDTPVLVQTGTQDLGAGVHNWFPDIHPDDSGRVAVAFNQSSAQEFVSVRRTFRLPTDPAGTLRPPVLQQESTSPETGSRWGDYGGVDQDPVEPTIFWNHHEYRTTSWRTWVGRFDVNEAGPPLLFTYPDGRPQRIDSDGGTTFTVEVRPGAAAPAEGTGILWVKIGSDFDPFAMQDKGGHVYTAEFPPTSCGSEVEYYISAETTDGDQVNDPLDAPDTVFVADSFSHVNEEFSDDFETDRGWTVVNVDLIDGAWERGIPVGDGSRGDPTADFDGSGQCYLTDNTAGNSDVDGGPTRLISPVFDLSEANDPVVTYAAWFYNDTNDEDRLDVEVSNNGGTSWVMVEELTNTHGWSLRAFRISDFVAPNDRVRIRFSATDNPNNSITEAAIDAVEITDLLCASAVRLTDITILDGTLISGGLPELLASDDSYLEIEARVTGEVHQPHLMRVLIGAVSPVQTPAQLGISLEGHVTDVDVQTTLLLREWVSGNMIQVGQFSMGLQESTHGTLALNASRFVRGGDGRIELEIRQINILPFTLSGYHALFDHLAMTAQ